MFKRKYLLIFLPLVLTANDNNSVLTSEDLKNARISFSTLCGMHHTKLNNNIEGKPKFCLPVDSGIVNAIKKMQNAHPYDVKDRQFIYFPYTSYKRHSFYINNSNYRLDIEGDSDCGHFVRIQLQIGTGNDHCYASILAPKDKKWHINHLYFAINAMCLRYFGKDVENIHKFAPGNPPTIKLDNPIFIENKKSAIASQIKSKKK